jgi:hypothetical protein
MIMGAIFSSLARRYPSPKLKEEIKNNNKNKMISRLLRVDIVVA